MAGERGNTPTTQYGAELATASSQLDQAGRAGTTQYNTPYQRTSTTSPSTTTGMQQTGQVSTGTSQSSTQNMDPASLAALQNLITTLSRGGTPQQQAEIVKKRNTQALIEGLLGQYTTGQANEEARGLMALNLQKALESGAPAISRAIEGAGTSASSMQALLSQNMSRDAALAASALGAEQAKAYGGITANLVGSLAGMATNMQDPVTAALTAALGVAKGAVTNTQTSSSGTQNTSQTSIGTSSGGTTTENYEPVIGRRLVPGDTASGVVDLLSGGRGTNTNMYTPTTSWTNAYNPGQSISNFLSSTGVYQNP